VARPLGVYVHVPFCSSRCGYCDFNTYTATELGDDVSRDSFHEVLSAGVRQAADLVRGRQVDTVFVGGGTPTLIGSDGLSAVLQSIRDEVGLAVDAEVTTEANPDTVDEAMLEGLRAAGFTRISLGMQSSAPHVLSVLERTHTPGASVTAAAAARRAGFEHVNLDLIYGTPGESDDDLRRSIDDALSAEVDHVSAYALIVEDGTPLQRRIARGELPMPDDDVAAARYELLDARLTDAGLHWYEVSNWARSGGECRHNLGYWRDGDWLAIGPGAHGHLDGERWWTHKHPRTYAQGVAAGDPVAGREKVSDHDRHVELVMLGLRLAEGLPLAALSEAEQQRVPALVVDGLLDESALADRRLALTLRGRLLADGVIRTLLA
jgi:oxygen-independent coproporphyrinogen-3 oxidase